MLTDKIAVIGFSAGGHLAGCAATMSKNRPNAAILGYPVIDGDCARGYQATAPNVIAAVDEHTCPCFIFRHKDGQCGAGGEHGTYDRRLTKAEIA